VTTQQADDEPRQRHHDHGVHDDEDEHGAESTAVASGVSKPAPVDGGEEVRPRALKAPEQAREASAPAAGDGLDREDGRGESLSIDRHVNALAFCDVRTS
jgi:hypothetical protein